MTDNNKVPFHELEIGTYFKLYGMLFVKISYDYEDDNVFNFRIHYVDLLEPDDEVEIVEKEKVEIKISE
ncbi:MAG: hypothetical protein J6W35_07065 [Eubacterium sp.]|nr:hypothetical protein [Eubacterium sp.]